MMVWKMIFLFQGCILRFHVDLPGCISLYGENPSTSLGWSLVWLTMPSWSYHHESFSDTKKSKKSSQGVEPCVFGSVFYLLGQWLNFQLFGITYLVWKIKFKLFFFRVHWLSEFRFGVFFQNSHITSIKVGGSFGGGYLRLPWNLVGMFIAPLVLTTVPELKLKS